MRLNKSILTHTDKQICKSRVRKAQIQTIMSDIYVGVGEWMASMGKRMENAGPNDTFHLPTTMHLHAFTVLQEDAFPGKRFRVDVHNSINNE